MTMDRKTLLEDWERSTGNRIVCSLEYTCLSSTIRYSILRHWHLVQNILGCQKPSFFGFKKTQNVFLKNLVRADLEQKPKKQSNLTGHFKCGHCAACDLTLQMKEFVPKAWLRLINWKTFSTCNTKYAIYLAKCPCDCIYVGKTKRTVWARILEHKSCIKHGIQDSTMVDHFPKQNMWQRTWGCFVLEEVRGNEGVDVHRLLAQRDAFWCFALRALEPEGLNGAI